MTMPIPVTDGLALALIAQGRDPRPGQIREAQGYPTRRLQRGLVLLDGDLDLTEEGVGFGLPVLKRGLETVFPGDAQVDVRRAGGVWEVDATYALDLVERLERPGGRVLTARWLYAVKDSLAELHRRYPPARGVLTAASSGLRRHLGLVTAYRPAGLAARVPVRSLIDTGRGTIHVSADLTEVPGDVTEVILMNELGAHHFDRYTDDDGADLRGDEIDTWDVVRAARAGFRSSSRRVSFTVGQAEGAVLRRGRELLDSRLAWAGFGYSVRPGMRRLEYDILIERTP